MADLVEAQLSFAIDRARTALTHSGPPVELTARAAETLGLALHELATNAFKYGALSQIDDAGVGDGEGRAAGKVDIAWELTDDRLRISWTETGGPPVTVPEREGFGSSVIRDIPAATLEAEVRLTYDAGGLRWTFDAPAENLLAS